MADPNALPDDKFVPCNGLLCCLTSVTNPLSECGAEDPRFPLVSNCICFCISCERIGECRPKAPKGQACITCSGTVKFVETFIGCTSVSINCCCDSRQSLPCNDSLVPQTVAMCCFVCFYKGEQKMVFGKHYSEIGTVVTTTV